MPAFGLIGLNWAYGFDTLPFATPAERLPVPLYHWPANQIIMRIYLFTIFFLIFGLNFVNAQRFGYIDTDYVLNKMPEYNKAQEEINQLSEAWEKEVTGHGQKD
jgi:hypothetical protein